MQLTDLQKQIVSKTVDKCLLFFGEETAIMDIYLHKIYKVLDLDVFHLPSVKEAFSRMTQKRLSGRARCFVVRDDKEFIKDEKIWKTVFARVASSSDYLILIYSSLDKRSKFYKHHIEQLTEFAKLNPEMLSNYINGLLPGLAPKERLNLVDVCEHSYSRILLECDKVKHFVAANPQHTNQSALEYLLKAGVIYQAVADITFKFTDAILTRNLKDTATYLQQARQKQESDVMILSILYSGFKHILMVQGLGRDQSEPVKRTGLTPWQIKLAQEKQGRYTIPQLINALKVIRFVEKGVKTGQIDSDISLEYAIINIM